MTVSKGPYKCEKNHFEGDPQIEFKPTLEFLVAAPLFKTHVIFAGKFTLAKKLQVIFMIGYLLSPLLRYHEALSFNKK